GARGPAHPRARRAGSRSPHRSPGHGHATTLALPGVRRVPVEFPPRQEPWSPGPSPATVCSALAPHDAWTTRAENRPRAADHFDTRSTYSCVRVSILTVSPTRMNSGTETVAPVSTVAGFCTLPLVSPRTPGSEAVTSRNTNVGSVTSTG